MYASFTIAAFHRSDHESVLEKKKATGQPDCLSEAAIAQSEASVLTMRGTEGSTAEIAGLAISFFIF